MFSKIKAIFPSLQEKCILCFEKSAQHICLQVNDLTFSHLVAGSRNVQISMHVGTTDANIAKYILKSDFHHFGNYLFAGSCSTAGHRELKLYCQCLRKIFDCPPIRHFIKNRWKQTIIMELSKVDISLISSSSFVAWLITPACPALMLRFHREREHHRDRENLSESLLLAKVLSCLYCVCSVIILIIWFGISSLPNIFCYQNSLPTHSMNNFCTCPLVCLCLALTAKCLTGELHGNFTEE